MTKARVKNSTNSKPKRRPALSPEARDSQMISYAYDLVEQRLLDGTASSQETTYFLKLGSAKVQLELEKLRQETELSKVKAKSIQEEQRGNEIYEKALKAFRSYSGHGGDSEEDDY